MLKNYIFGDTGGHVIQLQKGLEEIGMNPDTYTLPSDIRIIHCGDLIHKGPSSVEVLQLVNNVMEVNPGQWVQLLGNHEFQYIKGAPIFWTDFISLEGQLILQSWLERGAVKVAHSLPGPVTVQHQEPYSTEQGVILTHAGITHDFWKRILQGTEDVQVAEQICNSVPISVITRPGVMLDGGPSSLAHLPVGPVWALGSGEVWDSWEQQSEDAMPFIQIHGHTAAFQYTRNRWWPTPQKFQEVSVVDKRNRNMVTPVAGSLQISVDPDYSKFAPKKPQPSLLILSS